ncbi:MAG TPA: hypothetical protein VE218_05640, partial [Acidobacteriaceae bacterium]|nr:hypothetical protein [Acidobacteriaceae bacterium]
QTDPVRVYANSMARAVTANDGQSLYENFAPVMRSAYSQAELLGALRHIREMFGGISHYEYRNATVGGQLVAGRMIRTATCWYEATTTKSATGAFLKVAVTYDHGRFYLAGYSVDRFFGNHIPPGLQGPSVMSRK